MNKPSVLPGGLELVGEIEGDDDLVVLGTIEGDVHLGGHLVVEAGGAVRGNVDARALTVRGTVVGDATATDTIRLDATARMVGDVRAPRVQVIEGALVRGRVEMTGSPPPPVVPREPRRRLERTPRPERTERRPRSDRPTDANGIPAPRLAPSVDATPTSVDLAAVPAAPAIDEAATSRSLPRPGPPPPRFPVLRRVTARRKN